MLAKSECLKKRIWKGVEQASGRGQRATCGSWFSPSHVGFRAWSHVGFIGVGYKCRYALSYLTNPKPVLPFLQLFIQCVLCMHVCSDLRANLRSQFSPFTFIQVPRMETRSTRPLVASEAFHCHSYYATVLKNKTKIKKKQIKTVGILRTVMQTGHYQWISMKE